MIWLWTILFRGDSGRVFNVGSSHGLPIAQIAEVVRETLQCALPVQIAHPKTAGDAPSRYVPCVELAEKELGLREMIALPQAIWRTAQWWLKEYSE
jgi:dTDP-glucose 4,6-dehydratase